MALARAYDCPTSCGVSGYQISSKFWYMLEGNLPRRENCKDFPRVAFGQDPQHVIEEYLKNHKPPYAATDPTPEPALLPCAASGDNKYSLECYRLVNTFYTLTRSPEAQPEFLALCTKLRQILEDPTRFRVFHGQPELRHAHVFGANIVLFVTPPSIPHLISVLYYGPTQLLTTGGVFPKAERLVEVADHSEIESQEVSELPTVNEFAPAWAQRNPVLSAADLQKHLEQIGVEEGWR